VSDIADAKRRIRHVEAGRSLPVAAIVGPDWTLQRVDPATGRPAAENDAPAEARERKPSVGKRLGAAIKGIFGKDKSPANKEEAAEEEDQRVRDMVGEGCPRAVADPSPSPCPASARDREAGLAAALAKARLREGADPDRGVHARGEEAKAQTAGKQQRRG
jgi:hypothetical protein